ncbi:ABC-three component system protein [Bacillus safensis]|uniref:ABC-three component system protein n=1 Tax=Bacillus safensis TaxID=561879 RepID=UPI0039834EC5
MSNHQASEQMIGYIYQIRYALYLLLENDDEESNISIEKFDDIAFTKPDGSENVFIQLKHHTKKYGDLTDSSTDIWRTLNVWINELKKDCDLLKKTKFLIITTAKSPENSASFFLTTEMNLRNPEKAFTILKSIAEKSNNKAHKSYYDNFIENISLISKELLYNVYVVDKSSNIVDTASHIKKILRYSCKPQYISSVFERLEGWWTNKAIDALRSTKPVYVNARQVASYIVDISQEYSTDNLPIDIDNLYNDVDSSSFDGQLFYEQLKLIGINKNKLKVALRDYQKAFRQRANWVRNDLLYLNELDRYESRLIDEWEHCFADMEDELQDYGELTDDISKKHGKSLFKEIENKDIRIRERCSEPFIMRGSYHILADDLKVGWHNDFKERLDYLIGREVVIK